MWCVVSVTPRSFTPEERPGRLRLKCDGTRAETRFRLSAKRTSPFKSAEGRQFNRILAAEVCASAVVMLDTPCSEVVWRILATHSIRQFPLHFPSHASPCAITFQLESTVTICEATSNFSIVYFLGRGGRETELWCLRGALCRLLSPCEALRIAVLAFRRTPVL